MIPTASSSLVRKGSSPIDMSQHQQSANNTTSTNLKTTTSTNNGAQSKASSGIKGLSFLKNNNHQFSESTQLSNSNSTGPQKVSKQSSKTKSGKQDQISTSHHKYLNDHDYHSAHGSSGVASFNAIFQPQTKETHDERIMLEEWLQKRSNSLQLVWKRRWCVLRDDCLYYYRSDTDTKPLGVLHLADFSILSYGPEISRKSKFAFRLSSPESISKEHQHHLFHAETPQALDLWLDAIQGHINHALANLEVLGPLDLDPSGESLGFIRDSFQPTGQQSIIDKVLDRLQLEDPTLSDMNDPSTLIMPAQEHPPCQHPSCQHPSYQHPTQKSFRELQISLDDNLDGWSPSPSSILHSSSIASTSANTSTSLSIDPHHTSQTSKLTIDTSSPQRSPIVIRRTNHGMFNGSGSLSQSSVSSITDTHSNYSSYSEISTGGNSINKNGRGSIQILDHQGRPSLQQSRGNHGPHSTSSSLSGAQQLHHYHSQAFPSPSLYPQRAKGQVFSLDAGCMSPSESVFDSPLPSPRVMELDCSAVAAGSYNLTDPICPSLKRTESSGSINSISASNSASGDAIGPHDIVAENGLMIVDPYQKKKKDGGDNYSASGSSKKSNWTKNYCSDNDLFPFETLDKEGKAALANEGKKSKKLWSVYGSSSPTTSSDKTGGGSSGNSKRSTSKSLDSDSSMFKNLVLVSLPSKKGGNSNATATTKGFSKSMVSLSRGSECDNHHYPAPPSPSDIHNYPLFSSAGSFTSRTRSPSVSVLDEANHSASHEYPQYTQNQSISNRSAIGDISSLRSPQLDANSPAFLKRSLRKLPLIQQGQKLQPKQPLPQKASTAPISLITNDWNTTIRGQRSLSQPLRCVDPELQQPRVQNSYISSPTKSTENVSRHIVAPDELAMAMAIDREAEGKRQQQGLECVEKSEKSNWKPTVDGTSEEKSHSVTILTVTPESEVSPTPTLTTIVEAASTLADDTTPRAGEETSASGSREQTQTAVTTTAAWSLPPPKRLNNPDGQETVTTQHTTRKITTRSSLPTHATSAAQAAEKRNSKGTDLECSKQPSSPAVKENDQGDEAHAIPLSAIKGTETQPAVAVNIGESLQGSTRESHASPTSSVSPPILPRRSPFRSAPIPPVNPANYTAS